METPTLANGARRGGDGAAWRRNHRFLTANGLPSQQGARTSAPLRAILAAAAEARRHGDHGAAEQLEHDAVVALRGLLRLPEAPA
jgi:hypothetical protein